MPFAYALFTGYDNGIFEEEMRYLKFYQTRKDAEKALERKLQRIYKNELKLYTPSDPQRPSFKDVKDMYNDYRIVKYKLH